MKEKLECKRKKIKSYLKLIFHINQNSISKKNKIKIQNNPKIHPKNSKPQFLKNDLKKENEMKKSFQRIDLEIAVLPLAKTRNNREERRNEFVC